MEYLTHVVDIVPVIMAGIIGIYGLVVSVLVSSGLKQRLPLYTGFIQLGAGLSVGLAGLAAGRFLGLPRRGLLGRFLTWKCRLRYRNRW